MNLSVMGLGMVSKIGDTRDLEHLLAQGNIDADRLTSGPALKISLPNDLKLSGQIIRRMNHFSKISLSSAYYALQDSGLDVSGKSIGIIQGSVYGPIISGVQALDELIDFGDNQLSPTNFSGSVFNASATYLSLAFGIQGCTLTHTGGVDTLYTSLLSASLWLENGVADYVIMGIGDEYTTHFNNYLSQIDQQSGLLPTCEGWTTFVLSKGKKAKYGKVKFGYSKTFPEIQNKKNIYSAWHEQTDINEFLSHSHERQICFPGSLRGSYPCAYAFDLALALTCFKKRRFPVNNGLNKNYQIYDLAQEEKISCYSISENHGVIYYDLFQD